MATQNLTTRLRTAGLLNLSSGLASLGSGFATLAAASAEARQFKIQGIFNDLNISNQKLKAQENAIFLREKFLQNVSSANASFASRNVSTGSGIGARFSIEAQRVLNEDLKTNDLNSRATQNSLELSKSQTILKEKTARNLGLISAGKSFSQGTQSLLTGFKTLKNENT
jgi:hypothetical protein